MQKEVEMYRRPTRILHWVHLFSFCILFLTGLVLFIPQLGILAQGSWTRIIHRIAAAVFIISPLIYMPMNWKSTKEGIKLAFSWGKNDLDWLKAAPQYYFLGDEAAMPPQGRMNTGQKLWWFIVIVFGTIFVITGLVMWFAKTTASPGVLQLMVFLHDVAFAVSAPMLFTHIYLGVIHPMMKESWKAIYRGRVSAEYAETHHGQWYQKSAKGKR
jgi:formate dehydrogenase subunit gamma